MKTYRLKFDISVMSYVGAAYATARAEERMDLDVDAGTVLANDGVLYWQVDVPSPSKDEAVALARKNLTYDAPLVSAETL